MARTCTGSGGLGLQHVAARRPCQTIGRCAGVGRNFTASQAACNPCTSTTIAQVFQHVEFDRHSATWPSEWILMTLQTPRYWAMRPMVGLTVWSRVGKWYRKCLTRKRPLFRCCIATRKGHIYTARRTARPKASATSVQYCSHVLATDVEVRTVKRLAMNHSDTHLCTLLPLLQGLPVRRTNSEHKQSTDAAPCQICDCLGTGRQLTYCEGNRDICVSCLSQHVYPVGAFTCAEHVEWAFKLPDTAPHSLAVKRGIRRRPRSAVAMRHKILGHLPKAHMPLSSTEITTLSSAQ